MLLYLVIGLVIFAGMGFPTKVQLIARKASEQWYINFPSAVAQALDVGVVVEAAKVEERDRRRPMLGGSRSTEQMRPDRDGQKALYDVVARGG